MHFGWNMLLANLYYSKQFEHWEENIFIVLLQAIYISNNVGMGWFFALVILRSRYYEKLSR